MKLPPPAAARPVMYKIRVAGRFTTLRMERAMWDAIDEICLGMRVQRHVLLSRIDARRDEGLGLTSAIRVFLISYWRIAADVPEVRVDEAVEQALRLLRCDQEQNDEILTMDRIAPELTLGRARMVAALCGRFLDHRTLGELARQQWRGLAPWHEGTDAVAGKVLVTLTQREAGADE